MEENRLQPYRALLDSLEDTLQELAWKDPDLFYVLGKELNEIILEAAQKALLLVGSKHN